MGVSIGNKSKHPVSYAGEGEILGPFLVQLGTAQTQLFAVDRPLGNSLRSRDPEAGLVLASWDGAETARLQRRRAQVGFT